MVRMCTAQYSYWPLVRRRIHPLARLYGSYEALDGGTICEAMVDFTGGVSERIDLSRITQDSLLSIMLKAYDRGSLMGCAINASANDLAAETKDGLVKGHAYSVTKVKLFDFKTRRAEGQIPLIQLRLTSLNPSRSSPHLLPNYFFPREKTFSEPNKVARGGLEEHLASREWRYVPEDEKKESGLTFDNDGEFFMSLKYFHSSFSDLEICNLSADSLTTKTLHEEGNKRWEMSIFEGSWVKDLTAGGCGRFTESFWRNPQYLITLTDADKDDGDGKCTILVALMQKNRRAQRKMGLEVLSIGFEIFHLADPSRTPKPLTAKFLAQSGAVASSLPFINLREVTCRVRLQPGVYCIIPSAYNPNEEGEFIIRVFSETKNYME
uniref:Calpain catalytic domain-containing protein n=1 Tax=Timema genevievae TaxID=629358 RepID=A0A7R9K2G5_TIMGE|nr:unnamed protein product [Timema genevievae]